jgi:hypothetical protein
MFIFIQLTSAGLDTGPFNLYSDVDGFTSPFNSGIPKEELLIGTTISCPDGTTVVRVMSNSEFCTNYVDIVVGTTTTTESPIEGCYQQVILEANDFPITLSFKNCLGNVIEEKTYGENPILVSFMEDCVDPYTINSDKDYSIVEFGELCSEAL